METLLEHPTNRMLGPWNLFSSSFSYPGVIEFNDKLKADRIALELFKRDDCFHVLSAKYLSVIKGIKLASFQCAYFEMLLASDLLMAKLNEKEKVQLLAMALERRFGKDESNPCTPTLVITILTSFAYPPFMEEVSPYLVEWAYGYYDSRYENVIGRLDYDNIFAHAKQFLNEQNK